jgi:hypothetical protein
MVTGFCGQSVCAMTVNGNMKAAKPAAMNVERCMVLSPPTGCNA